MTYSVTFINQKNLEILLKAFIIGCGLGNAQTANSDISEISIENYLSEQKELKNDFINKHRRIQLNASPGSGKTTFIADPYVEHLKKAWKNPILCSIHHNSKAV